MVRTPGAPGRIPGEITEGEARFLEHLAAGLSGEGPIVEIGTHLGRSTVALAAGKEGERELITVDNCVWNSLRMSPELFDFLVGRILELGIRTQNISRVIMDKADFYADWKGPVPAMIFLDADHSYEETAADLEWALSTGSGLICGHDYRPEHPGVIRAVDERGGPRELHESIFLLRGAPDG
jgi:predicted O-methyltransferase YrrM